MAASTRWTWLGSAAAVTGAASGIGRALALELAARGCELALADVDLDGLRAVADEIQRHQGRAVFVQQADVAQRAAFEQFARDATERYPRLNVLINNAGVALHGQFVELEVSQIEWLMGINFWGVVYGTHAFLPQLQRQPRAHIVNLSSIFGVVAAPGNSAYCASKFAVRGFSESLRHELQASGSTVGLSVVHPGGVRTQIVRHSRAGARLRADTDRSAASRAFEQMARTTPEAAARRILRGIERNQPRILIGSDARVMELVQRLQPVRYWPILSRLATLLTGPR